MGSGVCLCEGYKQEKKYFTAVRKSRREVRVGGQCGAVAIAQAKELARNGQVRTRDDEL